MDGNNQDYAITKRVQGKKFNPGSLQPDLQNAVAGQKITFKVFMLFLVVILAFLSVLIASCIGGVTGLHIVFGQKAPLPFRAMAIITTVVILSSTAQNLPKTFLAFGLSFFTVAIVPELLANLSIIKLPDSAYSLSLRTLIATAFGLGCSIVAFLGIRLALALSDVLFIQPRFLKFAGVPIGILAAFVGSQVAISGELTSSSSEFREILAKSTDARTLVTVSGIAYGLGLTLMGWLANYLRDTPWAYPDLLHSWVLAIGSWRGTSFVNLDLSDINFRYAKLANSDLRARKLYRTCFQGAIGLERARVDNQYLDLEYPKVQLLLTHGSSRDKDFQGFNLRGAYLQNADLRSFDFTDTNLTGADLKGADLRESALVRTQLAGVDFQDVDLRRNILIDANLTEANLRAADLRDCILVRAQVARADFSGADLTGICIEDWSVSSKTKFTGVRCEYIYRRYRDGQPTDRYPVDRNFEPGEFASLFQQPENELELVFKGEEFDYTALSLTFDKLQTDKPDLKLKLQGIEQRQDLWVVKVTSDDPANVESRIKEIQDAVYQGYEITTTRLENNPLIRRIISDVANIKKTQEEIGEEVNQLAKRIGSNFYFLGGTITNVTGAGEIKYTEASSQVRSLVTGSGHETQVVNTLLNQLRSSNVATTANEQTELIQFVILEEAQRDPQFKQFLLQQAQQILAALPESSIATAIRGAIAQLESN